MTKTGFIGLVLSSLLIAAPVSSQTQDRSVEEQRSEELPNFARVNGRLYRGGQPRNGGFQKLADLGIKTIINLRDNDENAHAEAKEAKAAGLNYFNIPFKRFGRPNDSQMERVLSLIDARENGTVFVHCKKGEDRTGMVIAVYRISHDRWTDADAIQEAKRFGMGFWQLQMKDYISDYFRDRSPSANSSQR
jgi:protein tyrosine/serine phosphatase